MPPIVTPSGIVPALSRPRSLIKAGSIILLGVSIIIYLLSLMDHDNWEFGEANFGLLLDGISFPSIRNSDIMTTRYCSAEEYASGQWVRRTNPPLTLDEIREMYGVKDRGRLECDPPGWPVAAKGTVPLDDPTHMARMLNHTRWMWMPGNDCHRSEISEEAFVVRMLRSRTGLILVGDSLTEQHHEIVRNFLVSNDGPYQFRSHGGRPRVDQVFLNPSHELTKHYLRVSGVTADRLKNPITTFFLERHLLSLAEFDQVNAHVEGYVPLSEDDGPHQWVSESLWDARYREQLERPVMFTVEDELDGEGFSDPVIEEPSLLVLNTGPHWIASEMSSKGVSDTDVLKSYNNMIEKVFHNLTANPSSNLKVYYRATSPGHISLKICAIKCEKFLEPVVENASWNVVPPRESYNWHLFESFNQAWQKRIEEATTRAQLDISYLDVWEMSLQRNDAHLLPPTDCMHYCYQGVPEEWIRFLWHEIVRESANNDYGIDNRDPVYL